MTFLATGSVEQFDEQTMIAGLSSLTGVPLDRISVQVFPASVLVVTTLLADLNQGEAIKTDLAARWEADSNAIDSALGLETLTPPTINVVPAEIFPPPRGLAQRRPLDLR